MIVFHQALTVSSSRRRRTFYIVGRNNFAEDVAEELNRVA
jgi:hypothetical protein